MNVCICASPYVFLYAGSDLCFRCGHPIAPSSTAPRPPSTGAAPAATAGEGCTPAPSPATFDPWETDPQPALTEAEIADIQRRLRL